MRGKRQKPEIGDEVVYPVTGTRGKILEIKKMNGKQWALIEPIYVWIDITKLIKINKKLNKGT